MTTLVISTAGLTDVIQRFNALPAQISNAKRRAISKTAKYVSTQAGREMAGSLGVAQKALKKRIASRLAGSKSDPQGLIWFGLNPIDAQLAGAARQTKSGVSQKGRSWPGAFMASIYSGEQKIWIRLHSKHYDSELYPYGKGKGRGAIDAAMSGRFPVVKARIPIDTPATRAIIAAMADKAKFRLAEVMGQELNYEINVKGAR